MSKMLGNKCPYHGKFFSYFDDCPDCEREKYIEKRIAQRTEHLIKEINTLKRLLNERSQR